MKSNALAEVANGSRGLSNTHQGVEMLPHELIEMVREQSAFYFYQNTVHAYNMFMCSLLYKCRFPFGTRQLLMSMRYVQLMYMLPINFMHVQLHVLTQCMYSLYSIIIYVHIYSVYYTCK